MTVAEALDHLDLVEEVILTHNWPLKTATEVRRDMLRYLLNRVRQTDKA